MRKLSILVLFAMTFHCLASAQDLTPEAELMYRKKALQRTQELNAAMNLIASDNSDGVEEQVFFNDVMNRLFHSSSKLFKDPEQTNIVDDIDPLNTKLGSKANPAAKRGLDYFQVLWKKYQPYSSSSIQFSSMQVSSIFSTPNGYFLLVYYSSYFNGRHGTINDIPYQKNNRIIEFELVRIPGSNDYVPCIVNIRFEDSEQSRRPTPPLDKLPESDRDGDGISDRRDKCPDEYGLFSRDGCPDLNDRDGDGINDLEDVCPDNPGTLATGGCPDRDGDLVPDYSDQCPKIKGLVVYNGCPDTDGDEIPDYKDECPYDEGPSRTNGCPDKDFDNVPDKDDKCPKEYGPVSNRGCPVKSSETITKTKKKNGKTKIKAYTSDSRRVKMAFTSIASTPVLSYIADNDSSKLRVDDELTVLFGGGLMFFIHNESKILNFSFGGRYVQKGFSSISGDGGFLSKPLKFNNVKFAVFEVPFNFYFNSRGKSAIAALFGMSFNYTFNNVQFNDPFTSNMQYDSKLVNPFNAGFRFGIGYVGNFRNKGGLHIMACYSNVILRTINNDFEYFNQSMKVKPFQDEKYRLGYLSLELSLRLW